MNNRRDFNLGDEIRNIVQDAVNNRDFNRLNSDIGNAVNGALDEVRRSIGRKREDFQQWNNKWNNNGWNNDTRSNQTWRAEGDQHRYDGASKVWNQNPGQQNRSYNSQTCGTQAPGRLNTYNNGRNIFTNAVRQGYQPAKPVPGTVRYAVPIGQVSGILLTVFGAIGSTAAAVTAVVLAAIGYISGSGGIYYTIALGMLPCLIVSLALSLSGGRIRKRIKRFQRYISQMHGRNYCLIKDLSSVTGRSGKYTVKDLQKMIVIGMFPEGHIDDKKTCFMLNSESYGQYLALQENMRMKDTKEQIKDNGQTLQQINGQEDTLEPEIRKAIDEGRQYVQKIRDANIAIPGEEISRKLDRLEEVTGKIFDYVELHPDKFPEIKKFTEYFLPTTLKLLDAYKELEHQPVAGENISTAKKEIEQTMDTINTAFENLLDGLFEDTAMDISTDISVLHTMFAQEGLTEKNGRI